LSRRPRRKLSQSQRSRQQKVLEAEAQLNILQVHIHEICGVNPEGWVLIVDTQMKRIPDVIKLEDLAQLYAFKIHWLTMGSKRRIDSKFNDIVIEILKGKNERRR
jgi:hypothetical protein